MPRRAKIVQRPVVPDARYNSELVTRFTNKIMERGKKILASRIFYSAIDQLAGDKDRAEGFKIFEQAVENVKPQVEVKSRRVGGANYQVPVEVRPVRRLALSMRWLKEAAKKRGEKSMALRLANELMEATEGRGGAMKKRDEVHRMAEANKAFSHFKW